MAKRLRYSSRVRPVRICATGTTNRGPEPPQDPVKRWPGTCAGPSPRLYRLRKDGPVPTPPPTDVIALHDDTPDEIESRAELAVHLAAGTLRNLIVQGLDLDGDPPLDLSTVDVRNTLFVGCRFASPDVAADLIRRGALVVPAFAGMPYPTHPNRLYTPDDLAAGFAEGGFAGMYDTVVYRHFRAAGGAQPPVREALVQRLHDDGIDNALADTTNAWTAERGPSAAIGVMGGHAVLRGSPTFRLAAALGRELARADRLVVTGGGPGVMEAANLGAFLAERSADDLAAAIDTLAAAPDFRDHDPYTAAALAVRAGFAPPAGEGGPLAWARRGGLSIPTWLYGHEPANLFAARIAKYFSNAIREDTILRLSRGGIVFAPGWAGTVQEVFQAATKTFYATDGVSGPYIFLDTAYWTERLPVRALLGPLLANSPAGDLSGTIHLTDDIAEAVALLTAP
jgi:predicted Rossmann-fold nucleotide-binding protein